MKIRLGELRKVIRRSLLSESDLGKIINDRLSTQQSTPSNPAKELAKKMFKDTGLPVHTIVHDKVSKFYSDRGVKPSGGVDAITDWVAQNYEELMKITRGGAVEPLGHGRGGDALKFTDGSNMVLKIEPTFRKVGTGPSGKEWQDVLWSPEAEGEDAKLHIPMIYDQGYLPILDEPKGIAWTIMEFLETLSKENEFKFSIVLYRIGESGKNAVEAWDALQSSPDDLREVNEVVEEMQLNTTPNSKGIPKWFIDLVEASKKSTHSRDQHSGNLGIRRRRGTTDVDWVFFD
jgi:hypothetical protein